MSVHIGLKFKTSTHISEIEDCLEANCKGEWDLEVEAISTNLGKKVMAVYFETEEDRDTFKSAYKNLPAVV